MPSYELRVHSAERDTLADPNINSDRIIETLQEVAATRGVLAHPKAEELEDTDIIKVRTGDYRTFCKHDGRFLDVLMIRHRKNAYRDLDTAKRRAGEI